MTTVAYRDGVMAADSGSWFSNVVYRSALKVARGPDGSLHGVTGNAGDAGQYIRWVLDGMPGDPPQPEAINREEGRSAFLALVVPPHGDVARVWTAYGWEDHHGVPFIAIGAGAEMAIGAMAAGASAERAVEIAAEYSTYAALPVRTVRRD
jgi:hypothetical protein